MYKINRKSVFMVGFAALFIVSMIGVSNLFADASAEPSKHNIPTYSEKCSHGHNSFACDYPSSHIEYISKLEQRVASLELQLFELQK